MSVVFAGNLKLYEDGENWRHHSEDGSPPFSAQIAMKASQYGYGMQFCKPYWSPWFLNEMPFEIGASPLSDASGVFAAEFQDPLDWEKIQFPTFLLELWQLPKVEAAMFMRITDGSKPIDQLISVEGSKEKPKPVSIYKMMDDLVALRARADIPNQRYYLCKKAGVLY